MGQAVRGSCKHKELLEKPARKKEHNRCHLTESRGVNGGATGHRGNFTKSK